MLLNSYFTIASHRQQEDGHYFDLRLIADCEVYQGHFPGRPVSPGVCSLQMIKECAEQVVGRPLMLPLVNQCRYTALLTPQDCPEIQLHLVLTDQEGSYLLTAKLFRGETTYLELKAQAVAE